LRLGKYKEALKLAEKARKFNPNFSTAWYNIGEALLKLENESKALAAFEKVLTFDPKDNEAWYMMARCLSRLNKKDEAMDALLVATAIEPTNRKKIRKEPDFASIRESERFKKLK
jgi:tetratricopeptide (TPR) repeat protein